MAVRKPLVLVAGQPQQLQAGDTLPLQLYTQPTSLQMSQTISSSERCDLIGPFTISAGATLTINGLVTISNKIFSQV